MKFFVLAAIIAVVSAYKEGPPVGKEAGICTHMTPSHDNTDPKPNTGNPFTFKLSQNCFAPTQTVKVEITTSKDSIEGFFIQARTDTFVNATASYGEFRSYVKHTHYYKCFGGHKNALGHRNGEPKVKTLTIYWQAPATGLIKDVQIGGTFVLHKKEFWINVFKSVSYKTDCKQEKTGEAADKDKNGASTLAVSSLLLSVAFLVAKKL